MRTWITALCICCLASISYAVDLPFTKDLFEGMAPGEEVYRLSIVLKKEGFYTGELTKTFTPALTRGVSAFQAKKGIVPINGIVGTKTRYELNTIVLSWIGKNLSDTTQAKKTVTPVQQGAKPASNTKQTATVKTVPTAASVAERKVSAVPLPCIHRGKTFRHGEKVRLYKYTIARAGGTCPSRIRVCVDGQLDGDLSYRHHTCTAAAAVTSVTDTEKATTKQPTLDDTKTTPATSQPKTTTPKTQPKDDTKLANGCRAGGVSFTHGQTTQGCIGPGRSDPTASQCLAVIMPVWKCEMSGNWTCITNCQHNYY